MAAMQLLRRILFLAFFLLVAWAPTAYAQKRVALVVGNSAYRYTPELGNPKNDAADIAAALRKHGFEVIEAADLDKAAFDRKLGDFAGALRGADAGVFFYAGHGLQVGGQNYLVPIDAKAEEEVRLELEMVRVDTVHRIMERQTASNVLFLDACRDNPLARNLARTMGTRSAEVGRGLRQVEAGVGTLISFSTQPGNVALEGSGRNSPYTGALVRHLAAPRGDLYAILIDVRKEVIEATRNRQVPWENSALTAPFYFSLHASTVLSGPHTTTSSAQLKLKEAAEAWDRTKDTASVAVLEAFIRRFGDTYYGDLAKALVEERRQEEERERRRAADKRDREEKEQQALDEARRREITRQREEQERRQMAEQKRQQYLESNRCKQLGNGEYRCCPYGSIPDLKQVIGSGVAWTAYCRSVENR
jgi:uncharacterized caspase-like protein